VRQKKRDTNSRHVRDRVGREETEKERGRERDRVREREDWETRKSKGKEAGPCSDAQSSVESP
jgi:hypothetical protein